MQELIDGIKTVFISIGTGIVAGGFGGGIAELYLWVKKGRFKISAFLVSIMMGCFSGYIVSNFTNNGAMAGLAGALSMKIFDIVSANSEELIKQYINKKTGINLDIKK